MTNRMIVGISGASGVVYGVRLLEILKTLGIETHLILSKAAEVTIAHELEIKIADIRKKADFNYNINDIGASISSGSYHTMGMIITPCSIRTMSEIASGITSSLLTRAADVTLKEQRKLVLMIRETPLHLGHLRTMTSLAEMGAIIAPPMPAFYNKPSTIQDLIDHNLGRVLDLFNLDTGLVKRWKAE